MGRRYFYHIVDETHASIRRREEQKPHSWDGYDQDPWYQNARIASGRKPTHG